MATESIVPHKEDRLRARDIELLRAPVVQEETKVSLLATGPDGTLVHQADVIETFRSNTPGLPDIIFDVRAIKDAVINNQIKFEVFRSEISDAWYNHILKNGGIEEPRVAGLSEQDLKRPLITILFPQGWTQIIDGNHRLIKRYRRGTRVVRYVRVTLRDCVQGKLACVAGEEARMLAERRGYQPENSVFLNLS